MTTLYLCAAGNPEAVRLAITVNETNRCWDRIVILDDDEAKHGSTIMGIPIAGPFSDLAAHQPGDQAVNLVARSTRGRERARARIESFGIPLTSLIHPTVDLRGATIGKAVTLYGGSVISALSTVGDHAIVFTQAVLGHGATLGVGAVLAPGAVVNARVRVGDRAYIGSNASVLPDLEIGPEATVSACSAVLGDVPAGCTALGVPAEIMGGAEPAARPSAQEGSAGHGVTLDEQDQIQTLFAAIFDAPSIGSAVNFFDAGGTSRQALDLQAALKSTLGIPVSVIDIFRFPTPALLANHLFGGSAPPPRPTRADMRRRRPTR